MADLGAAEPVAPLNGPTEASWAIGRLRALRKARRAAEAKVARLRQRADDEERAHLAPIVEEEALLRQLLVDWAADAQRDDGSSVIHLPGGRIEPAPHPDRWSIDVEAFLRWAERTGNQRFISVTIDTDALDRDAIVLPDRSVALPDGTPVEGVRADARSAVAYRVVLDDE